MLDQEALAAYRRCWQRVADVEAAERRAASLAERWQQMNALLRQALALELPQSLSSMLLDAKNRLTDHVGV